MATFMDVHDGFFGVTADQLREAHDRDLAIERDEGVALRARVARSGGRQGLLPRDGTVEGGGHEDPRACGPPHAPGLPADRRGLADSRDPGEQGVTRCSHAHSTRSGRITLAAGAAALAGMAAGAVSAGEVTGNGDLKEVNGRSFCAFSGQEDLQWFTDDGDTVRLENPVKGGPGHAQNWGQIPKADPRVPDVDRQNPGIACNPNKSTSASEASRFASAPSPSPRRPGLRVLRVPARPRQPAISRRPRRPSTRPRPRSRRAA